MSGLLMRYSLSHNTVPLSCRYLAKINIQEDVQYLYSYMSRISLYIPENTASRKFIKQFNIGVL